MTSPNLQIKNTQTPTDSVKPTDTPVPTGSPQRQSFTYDDLDRLTSASASGGSGGTYALEYYNYDSSSGNLSSKAGVSYTYSNGSTPPGHHVTSTSNGWTFGYDANGNMTSRDVGTTYTMAYDVENRLVSVTGSGGIEIASFDYDGDGNRVKGTVNSTTIVYIGDYYEWMGSTSKKYFYAGGQRAAMRDGSARKFLLDDHLGSTAVTTSAAGGFQAEVRYKPWGENRYTSGTTPTTFRFTGQRQEADLGGDAGLYFYKARWYDAYLNRWLQPDSIIPDPYNPLDWDRFAYAQNNPIKYIDPTGHKLEQFGNGASIKGVLKILYHWDVKGYWSEKDLQKIYDAGKEISSYVKNTTGKSYGNEWIRENLGNTKFDRFNLLNLKFLRSNVAWRSEVRLVEGFDKYTVIHELGHVLDNNMKDYGIWPATWRGGGAADELVKFVGGKPRFVRFAPLRIKDLPSEYTWIDRLKYGNSAPAEYFAQSFTYAIKDPLRIPGGLNGKVNLWFQAIISLQVDSLQD